MSFHHLDQFAHVESALTRRPPVLRLTGTVAIALGAALLPLGAWTQLGLLAALVLALAALARLRPMPFLLRFLPPFAFVLLASLAILIMAPGETVAALGPLRVTDAGVVRFASAMGRAAVALGAAVILVATTTFPQLLQALDDVRTPRIITAVLGLAYRYLYVLTDEVGRLRRAARSRNVAAGATPRRRLLMDISAVALQRSFARSERVYQAMLSRGYTGRIPTLAGRTYHGHTGAELVGLIALVAAVTGSAYL